MKSFIRPLTVMISIALGLTIQQTSAQEISSETDHNDDNYSSLSARAGETEKSSENNVNIKSKDQTNVATQDIIIVTGTQSNNRTITSSESPIDIIKPEDLLATGTTELSEALTRILPSLNYPRPPMTDGGTRPLQLRGLSPEQVLILVNGKRRHTTALVNTNGIIGRGTSGVDMNAIPISAISRIEVLRDGASAQYGSDAIAGVVNIILKDSGQGGRLSASSGRTSRGDGRKYELDAQNGVTFADKRGTLDTAVEIVQNGLTNRAQPYYGDISNANTGNFPGYGKRGFIIGDPKIEGKYLSLNSSFNINQYMTLYSVLMGSNRISDSYGFYRSKNFSNQGKLIGLHYPEGFSPNIHLNSKDRSAIIGIRGYSFNDLSWDVSYDYGRNVSAYETRNSINFGLGSSSPTSFYDGSMANTQHVINADINKPIYLQKIYSATFSMGAEYRHEQWEKVPGSPLSYEAQGFGGFNAIDGTRANRHSYAIYTGLETEFTRKFSAGVAVRFENYSDFGKKTSGKLSSRYEFNKLLSIRATASSGFRAPTLAQQNYQATSNTFQNNQLYTKGTFPVNGSAAKMLGATPLKAESSKSYSIGFVTQPSRQLSASIDAYQIKVNNRIDYSSTIPLSPSAIKQLAALNKNNVTAFAYFTNILNTQTRGVDLTTTYSIPFSDKNKLDLSGGYAYTRTKVDHTNPPPPIFQTLGITRPLVGRDELGRIEEAYPKHKASISALWSISHWNFGLISTYYGSYMTRNSDITKAMYDQKYSPAWVLDASVALKPSDHWTLKIGADNLLNKYPDKSKNPQSTISYQIPYTNYSPFGFNGRYVYASVTYNF